MPTADKYRWFFFFFYWRRRENWHQLGSPRMFNVNDLSSLWLATSQIPELQETASETIKTGGGGEGTEQ